MRRRRVCKSCRKRYTTTEQIVGTTDIEFIESAQAELNRILKMVESMASRIRRVLASGADEVASAYDTKDQVS